MSSFVEPTPEAMAAESAAATLGHGLRRARPALPPARVWITFSGILLIIAGFLNLVDGLWALDRSDSAAISEDVEEQLWFFSSLGDLGWVYTIVGIALLLVGIGVLTRNKWARWIGIGAASASMVVNMMWVFVYPTPALIHVIVAAWSVYGLNRLRRARRGRGRRTAGDPGRRRRRRPRGDPRGAAVPRCGRGGGSPPRSGYVPPPAAARRSARRPAAGRGPSGTARGPMTSSSCTTGVTLARCEPLAVASVTAPSSGSRVAGPRRPGGAAAPPPRRRAALRRPPSATATWPPPSARFVVASLRTA
jgi:hypothetical protein